MVISCCTCQKEETKCFEVEYLIDTVCRDFKFVPIHVFFPPNVPSQISEFTKKWFFQVWYVGEVYGLCQRQYVAYKIRTIYIFLNFAFSCAVDQMLRKKDMSKGDA